MMGRAGDSAMCVWTAPGDRSFAGFLGRRAGAGRTSDTRARANACEAALEIRETLDRFNERHATPLRTRIGVHVGEVAMGPVSGEYHVVGDVPNTASRIEGLNKLLGTTILASEAVVREQQGLCLRHGRTLRPRGQARRAGDCGDRRAQRRRRIGPPASSAGDSPTRSRSSRPAISRRQESCSTPLPPTSRLMVPPATTSNSVRATPRSACPRAAGRSRGQVMNHERAIPQPPFCIQRSGSVIRRRKRSSCSRNNSHAAAGSRDRLERGRRLVPSVGRVGSLRGARSPGSSRSTTPFNSRTPPRRRTCQPR